MVSCNSEGAASGGGGRNSRGGNDGGRGSGGEGGKTVMMKVVAMAMEADVLIVERAGSSGHGSDSGHG